MTTQVKISSPSIETVTFKIRGDAPLMTARFSKKAELMDKMSRVAAPGKKPERTARDYDAEAAAAAYVFDDGTNGIPASAFRAAMISACRLVGFKMTIAKMSIFVVADGFDARDSTPLVRINAPPYEVHTMHTRNATGVVDIRARPMYKPGWEADVTVRFDSAQFSLEDVTNLMMRVGIQVGLCEGRPDSKSSAGLGFGTFELQ